MNTVAADVSAVQIRAWWHGQTDPFGPTTDLSPVAGVRVRGLVAAGLLDLPLPGSGRTLDRFDALSALGELDLTTARLAEAHADASAILSELDGSRTPGVDDGVWGVWAAEPPNARVAAHLDDCGQWHVTGRKAWCSGAGLCSHALITAHADDGPRLFAIDMDTQGVCPVDDPWPAPALAGTDTRSVDFADVVATPIGGSGAYVGRPGFWHGAAGVAAVWHGGAVAVARALLRAQQRRDLDAIDLVHLGAADVALASSWAALVAAAIQIDADPHDGAGRAEIVGRRCRGVVEGAAVQVVDRVGRALGAAPLALDRDHARRVSDLQLYLRQSHADRDLAELGRALSGAGDPW